MRFRQTKYIKPPTIYPGAIASLWMWKCQTMPCGIQQLVLEISVGHFEILIIIVLPVFLLSQVVHDEHTKLATDTF
jgi:hypothetical protein